MTILEVLSGAVEATAPPEEMIFLDGEAALPDPIDATIGPDETAPAAIVDDTATGMIAPGDMASAPE